MQYSGIAQANDHDKAQRQLKATVSGWHGKERLPDVSKTATYAVGERRRIRGRMLSCLFPAPHLAGSCCLQVPMLETTGLQRLQATLGHLDSFFHSLRILVLGSHSLYGLELTTGSLEQPRAMLARHDWGKTALLEAS